MIRNIIITEDLKVIGGIPLSEVKDKRVKWFWTDFDQPTEEEVLELSRFFHFHHLAIEDCINELQRPKLDYYQDYTFFVIHALNRGSTIFERKELDFFIGENYIVSFHQLESPEIHEISEVLLHHFNGKELNPSVIFHQIINKHVDQYFPLIYEIEDTLVEIENNNKMKMERLLDNMFTIRHQLLFLRQTIHPMRDLLYRILNSERLEQIQDHSEYFSDIYDHLMKLSGMVESNREVTADIRDSYLSLSSHRTNRVMQVLTVITTIFMPLTFIAGIYGMNFKHMPELNWKYGYFMVIGIMLCLGIGMYLRFRSRGWLR